MFSQRMNRNMTNCSCASPDALTAAESSVSRISGDSPQHPTLGDWGLADGLYLWPTIIRILLVFDGRVTLGKGGYEFGLGYVLETLHAGIAWWVDFEVDLARRFDDGVEASTGVDVVTYKNFKFTDAAVDLNSYNQVWLFGDEPNEKEGYNSDADIAAFGLDDAELKLLAEWMDRGGGVFAVGDHGVLGAGLCSRVPRVRTMRKWTNAQGVPAADGPSQNHTLQPEDYDENDAVLQPVELVYQNVFSTTVLNETMPHPLLCSQAGVIDRFPDHMHEGEVFPGNDVELDLPLNIPGYAKPEYPEILTAPGIRPKPRVIAYGRTTTTIRVVDPTPLVAGGPGPTNPPILPKRFALVGVYDGESANIGRVVVDSTWHHWFSFNLTGIVPYTDAYQKMQAYYRNVALWLSHPQLRISMAIAGVWGVVAGSAPDAFIDIRDPLTLGERIIRTLAVTTHPCIRRTWADTVLGQFSQLGAEPFWTILPADITERAVVGSLGAALLDLALEYRKGEARGNRPPLDLEAIRKLSAKGIQNAYHLVRKLIADCAAEFSSVHTTLQEKTESRIKVELALNVRRIRVVAEKLQFPDPSDPALVSGEINFTIQASVKGMAVAHRVVEKTAVPSFEARGGIMDLGDCVVGEFDLFSGQDLTIEILVGDVTENRGPDAVRFTDILRGPIAGWSKSRTPARSQPWRLWYRIDY
jgi:hypothetical protein